MITSLAHHINIIIAMTTYLNALHIIDLMRIRFFHESGFTLQEANRIYGHAPIGLLAVEFQLYNPGGNYTLNLRGVPCQCCPRRIEH